MFDEIYDNYINKQSNLYLKKRLKTKKTGWFSASTAGSCFKKQYYEMVGTVETDKPNNEAMRKMRLGTIVHKDFEESMKDALKKESKNSTLKFFIEYPIEIPDLKVHGTLDCAIYDESRNILTIGDLKTIGSYPYKLRFGREKSKNISKVSTNYELQVSTYTIGLVKEIEKTISDEIKYVDMQLIFYNKDTSRIKIKTINSYMKSDAIAYWEDLNDFIDEAMVAVPDGKLIRDIKPNSCVNVPTQQWECNYCRFRSLCQKESE